MISLFDEVLKEFENIKKEDFIEPPLPFDPKKHVFLAEMSENLKKLFTLWFRARYRTRDLNEKFELTRKVKDEAEIAIEMNKAATKEQALEGTFWYAVYVEHPPKLRMNSIAVTKGFRVVYSKE
jgi:hypothetical protein